MSFDCGASEKFVSDIMGCIPRPEKRNPYWLAANSIESEFRKAVARIRELEGLCESQAEMIRARDRRTT